MSGKLSLQFVGGDRDGQTVEIPVGRAIRPGATYWHSRGGQIEHRELSGAKPSSYRVVGCKESASRFQVLLKHE